MKLGRGKAWVFEGILDVDWEMLPWNVESETRIKLGPSATEEEINKEYAKYLMVNVDPDFPKKVQPGDYIVGGEGMGYGHDHRLPIQAMKGAGVVAILCENTNTNFKRNSINLGVPLVEIKGILTAIKQGDELEVDLNAGVVKNLTSGKELRFMPYTDFLVEMMQAGGLYPQLKSTMAARGTSK